MDSAGATVLTGTLPSEAFATVADQPLLQVTEAEATPLFRVSSLVPASSGSFVVLDAGNHRALRFDSEGALQSSHGAEGDGPGEFQLPTLAVASGDSTLVYDQRHGRVSVLGPELQYVRAHTMEALDGSTPPRFHGKLRSGPWVGSSGEALRGLPSSGILRRPSEYFTFAPGDSTVNAAPPQPFFEGQGPERWVAIATQGGQITSVNIVGYPFFRNTVLSVKDDLIAIGDTDLWCVALFRSDASLLRKYCADVEPEPFGPDDLDAYVATLAELTPAERRTRADHLDDVELPPSLPAYVELQIDDEQRVWVRQFAMDPAEPQVWTVLAETGALGTVTLPPRFALRAVHQGRVFGVHRDDFDVESVRVHELTVGPE